MTTMPAARPLIAALLLLIASLAAIPVASEDLVPVQTVTNAGRLVADTVEQPPAGPACDPSICPGVPEDIYGLMADVDATVIQIRLTDGVASSDTPAGATCDGATLFSATLPGVETAAPTGTDVSCVQLTFGFSATSAAETVAVDVPPTGPNVLQGVNVATACDPTEPVCVDIDSTPLSGNACEGRFWHDQPCEDNSIDESVDYDGDGQTDPTPTWILIKVLMTPQSPVAGVDPNQLAGSVVFPDGRGIVLNEIHIKWPSDDPSTERAPDFAGYATQYSNLDNDDSTDYDELANCLGGISNPTNPYADCNDWDSDGLGNTAPADPNPRRNDALRLRVIDTATGNEVAADANVQAPAQLNIQFFCSLPADRLDEATLHLGHDYLGPVGLQEHDIPCDKEWHSVSEVAGSLPTYHWLKSQDNANDNDDGSKAVAISLDAATTDGYALSQTRAFKLLPFDAVKFELNTNGRTFAPVSLAGSQVTCRIPAGLSAPTDSELTIPFDAAIDDANGAIPTSLSGCSSGGTATTFQPTYYRNAAGTPARGVAFSVEANFAGANPVQRFAGISVDNLAETGTLVPESCTPSPCSSDSTTVNWAFTPTTLNDEEDQAWTSVTLTRDDANRAAMTLSGGVYRFTETRAASDSAGPYNVKVLDASKYETVKAAGDSGITLDAANVAPDIEQNAVPREVGLAPGAETQVTVETLFTAIVTDAGGLGGPGNAAAGTPGVNLAEFATLPVGDTINKAEVWLVETSTIDPVNHPVSTTPILLTLSQTSPAQGQGGAPSELEPGLLPPETAPAGHLNGATADGELYYGVASLSPFKGYRYCYFVQDSGGLTDTDTNSDPDVACPGPGGYLFNKPPTAGLGDKRPFSGIVVVGTGAVASGVGAAVGVVQDAFDLICGEGAVEAPAPATADLQACIETIVYEDVCVLGPGPHDPEDLADCQADIQELVQQTITNTYGAVEDAACGEDHELTGDCAATKVNELQQQIEGQVDQLVAALCNLNSDQNPLCGGDLGTLPVPDPQKALTGEGDCDFTQPLEWGDNPNDLWHEDCNGDAGDLNGLVEALLDFIGGDGQPGTGLPGDEIDPEDRNGDGSSNDPNGQHDTVETHVLAYDPDEDGDDLGDRFDGATPNGGLTLVVFSPVTTSPQVDPKVLAYIRVGDVAGTPASELLVIEDHSQGVQVICVFSNGPADLFVYQGAQAFRQGGNSPEQSCGSEQGSTGGVVNAVRLSNDLLPASDPARPRGFMVWTDLDGDGKRTADEADNADASKTGTGDVAGFRIVPTSANPLDGFTLHLNVGGGNVQNVPVPDIDSDDDGVPDDQDLCQGANDLTSDCALTALPCDPADQSCLAFACATALEDPSAGDTDGDGLPDSCDPDDDEDGVDDSVDSCPRGIQGVDDGDKSSPNGDPDGDGCKNSEDLDDDNDGVLDAAAPPDNCPVDANTDQADHDSDGQGDACDNDDDNDGLADGASDDCSKGIIGPADDTNDHTNDNGDRDGDGCKNSEDDDDDDDGKLDGVDTCPRSTTGAASGASTAPTADPDGDGCKNSEDSDDDNDGVADGSDNCPTTFPSDASQADHDGDAQGDACDTDDDNDTKPDGTDACPLGIVGPATAGGSAPGDDFNDDGCKNSEDPDDDGDSVADADDACPQSTTALKDAPAYAELGAALGGCFPDDEGAQSPVPVDCPPADVPCLQAFACSLPVVPAEACEPVCESNDLMACLTALVDGIKGQVCLAEDVPVLCSDLGSLPCGPESSDFVECLRAFVCASAPAEVPVLCADLDDPPTLEEIQALVQGTACAVVDSIPDGPGCVVPDLCDFMGPPVPSAPPCGDLELPCDPEGADPAGCLVSLLCEETDDGVPGLCSEVPLPEDCDPTSPPTCGPFLQAILGMVIPDCPTTPPVPGVNAFVCFGNGPTGILTGPLGLRPLNVRGPVGGVTTL